jgi:rhodanese-related sulfurtransferase
MGQARSSSSSDADKLAAVAALGAKYKASSVLAGVEHVSAADAVRRLGRGAAVQDAAQQAQQHQQQQQQEQQQLPTPLFIDCRPDEERSVATIAGSIPLDKFDGLTVADGTEVIIFCTAGYRSGVAVKQLQTQRPALRARNLEGGILAWVHAGGDVVDSEGQPTTRVHVYGSTWNLLPHTHTGVVGPPGGRVAL